MHLMCIGAAERARQDGVPWVFIAKQDGESDKNRVGAAPGTQSRGCEGNFAPFGAAFSLVTFSWPRKRKLPAVGQPPTNYNAVEDGSKEVSSGAAASRIHAPGRSRHPASRGITTSLYGTAFVHPAHHGSPQLTNAGNAGSTNGFPSPNTPP